MTHSHPIISRSLSDRPLRDDHDFWRMRALLIDAVSLTPIGFNWDMRRLDGKRFYNADASANQLLARPVQLWETGDGQLVGFVLAEGADDAHLNLHPDYRCLEGEMIDWAMAHLAAPSGLEIYVYEYDVLRQRLLTERGFAKTDSWGMIRYMRLEKRPLAKPVISEGYVLRPTNPDDPDDCQRIADLLNAAFGRAFHNAAEYYNFCKLAPCFLRELDLVMVAADGSFAAYVGAPYDETNRRGVFEPVCTHPHHLRRGLATALMQEARRRLQEIGAIDATVDTGDRVAANRFYDSLGFTEAYQGYAWRK